VLLGLPEFEWLSTYSVEQTCALLAESGDDTMVIAGGTDLLTKMKHRRTVPRRIINIKQIPHLDRISYDETDGLRIGALATVQAIETAAVIARRFPALKQAAAVLGTTQIRNTATLGGNLANASPSAEFAPPLIALGASVRCVGLGGERRVAVEELFVAPGKTVLRRDELLTEVHVPALPAGAQSVYLKHSLRRMDVAIASAAVFLWREGDLCREVRIALGAVGPTPFRATKAEAALRGQRLSAQRLEEAARVASHESVPIDDLRAYAAYRCKLVAMLVGEGLDSTASRTSPA